MKRRTGIDRVALTLGVAALVAATAGVGCKKAQEERITKTIKRDAYEEFLTVETKPIIQTNDILDVETYISIKWEEALNQLGIIEREGSDLWLRLVITKIEFCNQEEDLVQAFDFEHGTRSELDRAIKENDTDPQVFNRIKFYRGGFTDNFGKPSARRGQETAIIHFPVYEELGHVRGILKLYGYIEVPPHYEYKKGEEGIYEKIGPKKYDCGLIAAVPVDATDVEKVAPYSKRVVSAEEAEEIALEEEEYIETVKVLADALRLRDSPDLSANTVTTLKRGAKLKVIEKSGDWYKVRTEAGQLGWAKAVHEGDILLD